MSEVFPNSIWREKSGKRHLAQELCESLTCDVAIIGGGFTGLRAAYELAIKGSDVVVLESRDIGWGASGRNGGQVNPMLPVEKPAQLRAAVGDAYFERMAEVSLNSADALFQFIDTHKIDCDPRQNGWIRANHSENARKAAYHAAELWNAFGAGFEFVEDHECHALSGSKAYRSAVVSPKGGAVHPLGLVLGLTDLAARAGVKLYKQAYVSSLVRTQNQWTVSCGGHKILAKQVIVATNGYSDHLVPGLKQSLMALTPIQIACKPLSHNVIEGILPGGHTISDTRRMIMYSRREPDNTFLFGGMGFRKPGGGVGGFGWLKDDLDRIFPQLRDVGFEFNWSGQIALTQDRVPHLHEPEPGLHVGLGYNGRGVAMSSVMGQVLAKRVLGASREELPFPTTQIKKYPWARIQTHAAGLGMYWMRRQDMREFN